MDGKAFNGEMRAVQAIVCIIALKVNSGYVTGNNVTEYRDAEHGFSSKWSFRVKTTEHTRWFKIIRTLY